MKRVWSRSHPGVARRKLVRSYYGLPKGEFTRRLAGMGLSIHDEEAEIKRALGYVADFLAWVRRMPCLNCRAQRLVEPHHVHSRGSRGWDVGNTVPCCWHCHNREHAGETLTVDLEAEAERIGAEWRAEHPYGGQRGG